MNIHPLNKIKIIGTLVGVLVVGLVIGIKNPDYATATANDNVHGWLWSDMPNPSDHVPNPTNQFGGRGLGYVSLNDTPPHNSVPPTGSPLGGSYGVTIDPVTGDISGKGWSEYGEWLDFDATGFPLAGGTDDTSAKMMPSCWTDAAQTVCKVIGWARFTAGTQAQAGGWDGWVSLNTNTAPIYGVNYNKSTQQFSGKAWGGIVAGWVGFDNAFATMNQTTGVCTDPNASNYTAPPLTPNQVSDPSKCIYPIDICIVNPSLCPPLSNICKVHPELCNTNYVCSLQFSPNTNIPASNYVAPPYTTGQIGTPNVCLFPGCTNPGAINYNKDANISDPDNPCQFKPGGPGGPGGPINPIYKEN